MGRAIVSGSVIVIIAVLITFTVIYFRRRKAKDDAQVFGWAEKGDLNRSQERALAARVESAEELMTRMLHPSGSLQDDFTILSDDDRKKIEAWLKANPSVKKGN